MEILPLNFGGQSNQVGGSAGEARFVNCYLEDVGAEGKSSTLIRPHEGLIQKAVHASASGTRGLFTIDDANMLWVAGVHCFHVSADFTVTSLGGVPGTGPVTFAKNRQAPEPQIMLAGEGFRFIVQRQAGVWTFERIADTDALAAHSCAFLDGYFLAFYSDGRFGWSSIDEGKEWAALDRATAEGSPDKLVRGFVYDRDIYLFGEKSLEIWKNQGGASTFSRAFFDQRGCKARFAVAGMTNGIVWVDDADRVQFGQLLRYQEIGRPVELRKLLEDTNGDELRAWSHTKNGDEFYTLASDSWCWQCNMRTQLWNERESFIDGITQRWRAEHYTKFGDLHMMGDRTGNKLYAVDEHALDEAGTPLTMTVQSPPQHSFPNGVMFHSLYVDVEPGVGLNSTDVHENDPQLAVRWSDDGARTFSNEMSASLGEIGNHTNTVQFNRLGRTKRQGRTWQIKCSAPVLRHIIDARVAIERTSIA